MNLLLEGSLTFKNEIAILIKDYLIRNNLITKSGYWLTETGKPLFRNDLPYITKQYRKKADKNRNYLLLTIPKYEFPEELYYTLIDHPSEGWLIRFGKAKEFSRILIDNKKYLVDSHALVRYMCKLRKIRIKTNEDKEEVLSNLTKLAYLVLTNRVATGSTHSQDAGNRSIAIKAFIKTIFRNERFVVEEQIYAPF